MLSVFFGELGFQLQQLRHHALAFGAFFFDLGSLGLHFFHLFLFVPVEQADTIKSLRKNKKKKRNKNKNNVAGCCFKKLKKQTDLRDSADVFTHNVLMCYDSFIIGVGGRTVGNKSGATICICRQASDLMGNNLTDAIGIRRQKSDDIPVSQRFGINIFGDGNVSRVKVGG